MTAPAKQVAKAVYGFSTTRQWLDALARDPQWRQICGCQHAGQLPHESTFSRAFDELARMELPQFVHQTLIHQWHASVSFRTPDSGGANPTPAPAAPAQDAAPPYCQPPPLPRLRQPRGEGARKASAVHTSGGRAASRNQRRATIPVSTRSAP